MIEVKADLVWRPNKQIILFYLIENVLHMAEFFTVLSADLIDSRHARDRAALAERIEAVLAQLGGRDWWRAAPMTTRGIDEMSAVLARPERAYDAAFELNLAIWPARFRVALADGPLDINPHSRVAADMDGPAFHAAAAATGRARDEERAFAVALSGIDLSQRDLVEALAHLHDTLMQRWSRRALPALRLYHAGLTQEQVAERLAVTQQAVSAMLGRAHWQQMAQARAAIRVALADWLAARPASGAAA